MRESSSSRKKEWAGQGLDLDLCPWRETLEVVDPGPHFRCLDRHATVLLVQVTERSAGVGSHCSGADIGPHVGPHWLRQLVPAYAGDH